MLRRYVVAGTLALSLAALTGCGTGTPWGDPLDLRSGEGGFIFARDDVAGRFTGVSLVGMPCTSGGRSVTVTGWDLPVDGAEASAELYVHSLPADARRTADAVDVLGTADGTAASLAEDGSLPYEVRPLAVGDIVGFGNGHPCTTFDKWNLIYMVDADYTVTRAMRTFF